MMKLNTDEKRSLQFDIRIEGIDYKELRGSVKFLIDNIEYGFPVTILEDHISSEILPLDEVVKKGLENGKEVSCILELFGDGFYLKPWEGSFKLASPVRVEAKMRADDRPILKENKDKKPTKKVTAVLLDDEEKELEQKKTSISDSDLMKRLKELLSSDDESETIINDPNANKMTQPETIIDTPAVRPKIKQPLDSEVILDPKTKIRKEEDEKRKLVERKVIKTVIKKLKEMKLEATPATVKRITEKYLALIQNQQKKKQNGKIQQESKKKLIGKKQINNVYELMESKGMTSPKTQKTIIETAKKMGGDDEDAIFSTVKQLLSYSAPTTTFQEYSKKMTMKGMED